MGTISRRLTDCRASQQAACTPGVGGGTRAARHYLRRNGGLTIPAPLPARAFSELSEQGTQGKTPHYPFGPGTDPGPSRACLPSPFESRRTAMPRQRTRHSRRTRGFPNDFPERFREASGMTRAELDRRLGNASPHDAAMGQRQGPAQLPAPEGTCGLAVSMGLPAKCIRALRQTSATR